jgi:hypothetical protein
MAEVYLPPETEELVSANRRPTRGFWMFWKAMQQAVPSGGAAPVDAQYIVGAADPTLTGERVVTDTATVTWDLSTPGQAKANATSGAPTAAEYLVGLASVGLSAERVVTDTATVTWDLTTPGQAKANAVVPTTTVDHVLMGDGATPPSPMSIGNSFLYVAYTP